MSLRQILAIDAVPSEDAAAVPFNVNLPATVELAAGEVNATTGLWLATVTLCVTVLETRPLVSNAENVNV